MRGINIPESLKKLSAIIPSEALMGRKGRESGQSGKSGKTREHMASKLKSVDNFKFDKNREQVS